MSKKHLSNKHLTGTIKYFLRHLEKEAERIEAIKAAQQPQEELIDFEEIDHFFRTIKMQNIFIFVVGVNGKPESSSLPKLIFSLSEVVRIYYSLSLDSEQAGFMRIRLNSDENLIVIERLHGYRPKPEKIYASNNPCHIIRFITRWLLRRIDWEKTKLQNLDIYKQYQTEREEEIRRRKERDEIGSVEEEPPLRLKDVLKKVENERRNQKSRSKPSQKTKAR